MNAARKMTYLVLPVTVGGVRWASANDICCCSVRGRLVASANRHQYATAKKFRQATRGEHR